MATSRRLRVKPSAIVSRVRSITSHPANAHHRVASLWRVARSEVQARATGKPVIVPIGAHSRIAAHLHAGGSWRAVLANPPDWNEMQAWKQHLRAGDLFVDVGAHAGVYTLWALDLGCTVVAAEPIAELVEQLRANLSLNAYGADVQRVALAAEPGTMTMSGPDLLRQHLTMDASGAGTETGDDAGAQVVDVTTLDTILGDRTAAGVKIDVEGAERLVLEGAPRALAERRIALLQLEWNDCSETLLGETREPVVQLLRGYGYELVRPDETGTLRADTGAGYGADLFARPSA
jgi:FkbM family methyltransferase